MSTTRQSHDSFNFNNYVTKVYYCSFYSRRNDSCSNIELDSNAVLSEMVWKLHASFRMKSFTLSTTLFCSFCVCYKYYMIYWLYCDSSFVCIHLFFQIKPLGIWRQKPSLIYFCIFTVPKLLSLRILKKNWF